MQIHDGVALGSADNIKQKWELLAYWRARTHALARGELLLVHFRFYFFLGFGTDEKWTTP